jgi:hypothetical protein
MGPFFGTEWSDEYALNHFSAQIVYLSHSRLLTPFFSLFFQTGFQHSIGQIKWKHWKQWKVETRPHQYKSLRAALHLCTPTPPVFELVFCIGLPLPESPDPDTRTLRQCHRPQGEERPLLSQFLLNGMTVIFWFSISTPFCFVHLGKAPLEVGAQWAAECSLKPCQPRLLYVKL